MTGPATARTCGEATIALLERYGVDVVFGIPGVHTLELCRGLAGSGIRHVQARNEQGAGFMADGYARASGRPGVAMVISGPGVTNALTPVGQAWADSIPLLLLSSEPDSATHGKGWGVLHEVADQQAVTAPLTARSLRAQRPDDVPEMLAEAFTVFASQRPRPVHVSIPIDVLDAIVTDDWSPVDPPPRPAARPDDLAAAAQLLATANAPVLMLGGGAVEAAAPARSLVELFGLPVVTSNAGKGIVPDDHPLSLSAATIDPGVQAWLTGRDVVLAVGTELAETDSFVDRLDLPGAIIRIDIDPAKLDDLYPAEVGIVADARSALDALVRELAQVHAAPPPGVVAAREAEIASLRAAIRARRDDTQRQHVRLLEAMAAELGDDTIYAGDICQIVYTGATGMVRRRPRTWSYPAGYCALGCGLPDAIGAKLALPDRDVVAIAGDGGFMFTVQELLVATEERLGIPVVIWANHGLQQIRDDMRARGVPRIGVDGMNPDFTLLARSMGADGVRAMSLDQTIGEIRGAFAKQHPTVIVIEEDSSWLTS